MHKINLIIFPRQVFWEKVPTGKEAVFIWKGYYLRYGETHVQRKKYYRKQIP
jgi:hypothetical protein